MTAWYWILVKTWKNEYWRDLVKAIITLLSIKQTELDDFETTNYILLIKIKKNSPSSSLFVTSFLLGQVKFNRCYIDSTNRFVNKHRQVWSFFFRMVCPVVHKSHQSQINNKLMKLCILNFFKLFSFYS